MFYIFKLVNNGWELILPPYNTLEEAKAKAIELQNDGEEYRLEEKTDTGSTIINLDEI